jgi:anthranilate/para-aminobenzoate synthase component I
MSHHIQLAQKRLFDKGSSGLTNLKLFPGTSRDTTSEQFAEQINRVVSQIDAGDFSVVNVADDED